MVIDKPFIKLYCKDARSMAEIADSSVHLIITSPPYFDLKNYSKYPPNKLGGFKARPSNATQGIRYEQIRLYT